MELKELLIDYHARQAVEMKSRKEGWENRVLSPWESDPEDKTKNEHVDTFNNLIEFHTKAVELLKTWH